MEKAQLILLTSSKHFVVSCPQCLSPHYHIGTYTAAGPSSSGPITVKDISVVSLNLIKYTQ